MEPAADDSKRKAGPSSSGDGPETAAKKPLLRTSKECRHSVAVPDGFDEAARVPDPALHGELRQPKWTGKMAKDYPFTLDPFQATSIACLERQESVMVAAHTSAGKTVVAEYAIAMAFRDKQRVIYTSPIKALSNQKFRELEAEFGDVGLMTGDVTQAPNANCVVMTTEILRSMLYRGSDILREVAWVIFDEIHYMQDKERGVVWEETIIFLPPEAKMVFLSATLSNSAEFAEWIADVHKQPCHVVATDFRPTPLLHYAFPQNGRGMHLVLDDKGKFRTDNWEKVVGTLAPPEKPEGGEGGGRGGRGGSWGRGGRGGGRGGRGGGRDGGGRGRGRGGQDEKEERSTNVGRMLKVIKQMKYDPVIFFSFGRRDCEAYAGKCSKAVREGKLASFLDEDAVANVNEIFDNAVSVLKEEDRELTFVKEMRAMLETGIAVHHSGLLPILKEIIELLFQEGFVKVLFATETFAMGVNMPARTVVFTVLEKWDGEQKRWLHSGEYTQMSGRAGRRGLDDCGRCIMMVEKEMDPQEAQAMLQGNAAPLISSFKLTYYTLLNLLRRMESSGQGTEYVISRSFQQFQQERAAPKIEAEVKRLEDAAAAIEFPEEMEAPMDEYQRVRKLINAQTDVMTSRFMHPEYSLSFLVPGRLACVKQGFVEWGWGVIIKYSRENKQGGGVPGARQPRQGSGGSGGGDARDEYTVDMLLPVISIPNAPKGSPPYKPAKSLHDPEAELLAIPVPLNMIVMLSPCRIAFPETDVRPPEARQHILVTLRKLAEKFPGRALPMIDPIQDMGVEDAQMNQAIENIKALEAELHDNPVNKAENSDELIANFKEKGELRLEAVERRQSLKGNQLATFRQEAKHRQAVLRRLQHIDENGTVLLKGRAACEIDTSDELLTTELMFNGVFNGLDKHQLVALVSCLVPVEKSNEQIVLKEQLAGPLNDLQDAARTIAEISNEENIEVNAEEYIESFKPALMDVIYCWSQGGSFQKITEMTDIFEGSIIRATRRLDELMRQLENAANAVGDTDLANKFKESGETIRRDIMFAASLYV